MHHDESKVFLLLTVLCDIACSCVIMQYIFCDSTEKCVAKSAVCSDVTLCKWVEIY
jgi:hypothetical protein